YIECNDRQMQAIFSLLSRRIKYHHRARISSPPTAERERRQNSCLCRGNALLAGLMRPPPSSLLKGMSSGAISIAIDSIRSQRSQSESKRSKSIAWRVKNETSVPSACELVLQFDKMTPVTLRMNSSW